MTYVSRLAIVSKLGTVIAADSTASRDILWVIRPPRRIIRDVSTDAIQRFLVANDVFVIAALPQGAIPAGTFIDAARGERLEAAHDFRDGVARRSG